MSSYPSSGGVPSFRTVLDACAQSADLPFRDVLTQEHIQALADEEGVAFGDGPGCVWSVALTIWTFLAQMLSKDRTPGTVNRDARTVGSSEIYSPPLVGVGVNELPATPRLQSLHLGPLLGLRSRRGEAASGA